jgi:glycosyltransferase involved in cell wall biosynthesis
MINAPEVTIGMSFKNPGRAFELALKSIFAQTFQDWEAILIDDNSSDGSLELVQRLADDRVRVFHDGESRPLSTRLNEAISCARGRYFLRMDADDIMHPDRLDHQVRLLRDHDDNTLIGSSVYSIDEACRLYGIRGYPGPGSAGFAVRHVLLHPTIGGATSWFAKHRYNPKYRQSEDAELYCRTAAVTKFMVAPEAWVYYREVGRFDLERHLGTHAAILQLLHRYFSKPRGRYLALASVELAKIGLYIATDAFNCTEGLRRRKPLSAADLHRAETGLEQVKRQALPTTR